MLSGGLRKKNITKQSQENMSLITVVTVVRNGEKTLEETMLSVINQTYTNIEYIIVDGASTDGTLDIIRKYEDRIDYWMSEPDGGIYDAMNKGIDLARGEWINFMNSGDGFYSEKIIFEINNHINSDIDIIYGDTCFNGKIIRKSEKKIGHFFFLMGHMICHQSIFAKAEYLKIHFNTKYEIVADRDWLISVIQKKAIYRHIDLTICYFDYSGISTDIQKYHKDFLKFLGNRYGIFGIIFFLIKRWIRNIINLNRVYNYDIISKK